MLSNAAWIGGASTSSELSIGAAGALGLDDEAVSWKSSSPVGLDCIATTSKESYAGLDSDWFMAAPSPVPTTSMEREMYMAATPQRPAATMAASSNSAASVLDLGALSFLSPRSSSSSAVASQSIAVDSDGSILLDENGHIMSRGFMQPPPPPSISTTRSCSLGNSPTMVTKFDGFSLESVVLGGSSRNSSQQQQLGSSRNSTQQLGSSRNSTQQLQSSRNSPQQLRSSASKTATTGTTILKPLWSSAPSGTRPTLFQKRALSRSAVEPPSLSIAKPLRLPSAVLPSSVAADQESPNVAAVRKRAMEGTTSSPLTNAKRRIGDGEEEDESGGDGRKARRKGMPAKNLLAERRRRKKLNDRLYMLRSVVPKISKMDRAAILGDAIDYLNELLQRIADLHNEIEEAATTTTTTTMTTTGGIALTSTSSRVKEEYSSSPGPALSSSQPAKIEVKKKDGKEFNIHMLCSMRPGLLLSMMRALDALGLDVQQAVITCFNGFVFDIFRAEAMKEGDVGPEEIKTVLLHTAGCHSVP